MLPYKPIKHIWLANTNNSKMQERIYNLFDSIMRGYPMETCMVWLVKKETRDATKFLSFCKTTNKNGKKLGIYENKQ